MKILYLLRHAKSSWEHPKLSDFDRPLSARGLNAAPRMGKMMLENGLIPDTIVSSPAERARQTAALVKDAAGIESKIRFDDSIYGASTREILGILAALESEIESVMLVGHNPTFENTLQTLTGNYERMPTAALAVIDMEIADWAAVGTGAGVLRRLYTPKEL